MQGYPNGLDTLNGRTDSEVINKESCNPAQPGNERATGSPQMKPKLKEETSRELALVSATEKHTASEQTEQTGQGLVTP